MSTVGFAVMGATVAPPSPKRFVSAVAGLNAAQSKKKQVRNERVIFCIVNLKVAENMAKQPRARALPRRAFQSYAQSGQREPHAQSYLPVAIKNSNLFIPDFKGG